MSPPGGPLARGRGGGRGRQHGAVHAAGGGGGGAARQVGVAGANTSQGRLGGWAGGSQGHLSKEWWGRGRACQLAIVQHGTGSLRVAGW